MAMTGAFNREGGRRRPNINITSLIDVMFLLLIFFMVSSTFKTEHAIDVTLPEAGTASAQKTDTHEILISAAGAFYLDGAPMDEAGLRRELQRIKTEEPLSNVVVRTDEEASAGRLVKVFDLFRELEIERMVIPTTLPESPAPR
jgi:biopolymer transport protein ExbD